MTMTDRQPVTEAGRSTVSDFQAYVAAVPANVGDFAIDTLHDAVRRDRQSSLDQIRGAVLAIEAQASQLSERRTAELVEALRLIRDLQPKALGYIEANGFVMDVLGPLPAASELDRWKVLAFSLYTDLCQANSEAERVLAATDATAPDAEGEE